MESAASNGIVLASRANQNKASDLTLNGPRHKYLCDKNLTNAQNLSRELSSPKIHFRIETLIRLKKYHLKSNDLFLMISSIVNSSNLIMF